MQEVQKENLKEDYIPRLLKIYREEIIPAMGSEFSYKNKMQTPKLTKIVINMGIGLGISDPKLVEKAAAD